MPLHFSENPSIIYHAHEEDKKVTTKRTDQRLALSNESNDKDQPDQTSPTGECPRMAENRFDACLDDRLQRQHAIMSQRLALIWTLQPSQQLAGL